ncbi:unnamed protein product [Paramecium sonneborni]|uniref:Uncharacterized protein n=1 Tax=Paramecium sonneborni TaxID=65129 RepID=A0A8S1KQ72_9CILI|nr:unnamed protein product [Paramecium sonneborni]
MKGNLKFCLNELGQLISDGQIYKGKLKISLNQEYLLSYSSYDRILYFINGNIQVYIILLERNIWI